MIRRVVLGLITGLWVMTIALSGLRAQQPGAPSGPNVAEIEKVKENLYVLTGGGGNTAAFVTANGVVLVDTKLANWGQPILDKVKTVTDKPITHIINTHTHGDHVGSNEFFPASVEIVAQENTGTNMSRMEAFKDPSKKHGLPDRTYKDRLTLLQGNDAIDLYYFGPAHTNGDTFVVFRNLRVMHAGDVFPGQRTPLIDMNNGASGVQYPATIEKAVAGIKNVDVVIPGHSAVTTWQAFVDYGEFNRAFLTAVQSAQKAGKTAEATVAELKLPDKFKAYTMQAAKDNVQKIYDEMSKPSSR
jgi:cyclase